MARARRGERRQEILQTLARLLEDGRGAHITTARLARALGVSEAALYRHFPSKARMFEALIEFIEQTIFTRVSRILVEESAAEPRARQILLLLLGFADKNPGMARLLHGGVLEGENERLQRRVAQLYDRLETQIKQILREGELAGQVHGPAADGARVLLALAEGRIAQFVRSEFRVSPVDGWSPQWDRLWPALFGPNGGAGSGAPP